MVKMVAEETPYDPALLLWSMPALEVAALLEGDYAYFGVFLDWQLAPFLGQIGWVLRGFNFRQDDDETLFIVKVVADDLPSVGFVSGASPRACVCRMLKKLARGQFVLYKDKYA